MLVADSKFLLTSCRRVELFTEVLTEAVSISISVVLKHPLKKKGFANTSRLTASVQPLASALTFLFSTVKLALAYCTLNASSN